jgi:hypothetical protein
LHFQNRKTFFVYTYILIMSKKKKSSVKPSVQPLSPKSIIVQRGRTYPIVECWINDKWKEMGEASIAIIRKMGGDKFAIGMYLLDLYCLGLKDGFYKIEAEYEKEELIKQINNDMKMMPCDATLAQNIIYGAIEYAEDLGFKPNKEFAVLQYLLEEVEELEYIEVEFGYKGKPMYIPGPHDNIGLILTTLNKSIGEGNYHFQDNDDELEAIADLDEDEYAIWENMSEDEKISYIVDYELAKELDMAELSDDSTEAEKEAFIENFLNSKAQNSEEEVDLEEIKAGLMERINNFISLKQIATAGNEEEEEEINVEGNEEDDIDYSFRGLAIDLNFYLKRFANIPAEITDQFQNMSDDERNKLVRELMNGQEKEKDLEEEDESDASAEYTAFEEVEEEEDK